MEGLRHAFTRAQRVRKRPDFVRIQDSPVRVTTRHLLLLLALGRDGGPAGCAEAGSPAAPRLGVVASRKVGPAVVRNRVKRLVREAFRLHPELFPAGLDVVIIVRADPRWQRHPDPPGTPRIGLAELAAELIAAGPALARRAGDLRARRGR